MWSAGAGPAMGAKISLWCSISEVTGRCRGAHRLRAAVTKVVRACDHSSPLPRPSASVVPQTIPGTDHAQDTYGSHAKSNPACFGGHPVPVCHSCCLRGKTVYRLQHLGVRSHLRDLPLQGKWLCMEAKHPITMLELGVVCQALQHFASKFGGQHIIVRMGNVMINNQGSSKSSRLHKKGPVWTHPE